MNADLLVINCPKHGRTGPLATSIRCGKCAELDRQELLQLREDLTACQLEIEQLRADNFRLSNRAWALAFLAYPIGAAREAVAGDLGLGCPECGVHFVPGATHWSECKSHPGEPVASDG